MSSPIDPVDKALRTLRDESVPTASPNEDLEKTLMQQMHHRNSGPKVPAHLLVWTVALLAVGGVTFAATGGISKITQWLQIEINGEVTEMELDENGSGEMVINTDDGGTAVLKVEHSDSPEDGMTTVVNVTMDGVAGTDEETTVVVEGIRKKKTNEQIPTLGVEVLGDLEPYLSWTNPDGVDFELYVLPSENGQGSRLFMWSSETADSVQVLPEIPVAPADLGGEGSDITVDDEGTLTIRIADGEREQVMKIRTGSSPAEEPPCGDIDIKMPDGSLKVRVPVGAGE